MSPGPGTALAGAVFAGPVLAGTVFAGPVLAGTVFAGTLVAGFAGYAQVATAQSPPVAQALPMDQARGLMFSRVPTPASHVAARPMDLAGPPTGQTMTAVPAVEDCGMGKSQVRPKSLILTCADANDLAKDLVWSKWGPTVAYATGIDTWNECVPYCAASKTWYTTKANFTLSKPVHTTKGWLFERLTVHITGQTPRKVEKLITFSEAPVTNP
ncbi:MAG TPA: hypothetical protein VMF65_10790 [Acidimicrobiales bacterium]|nr:hypothetical protein [Acidimicrobiales bacterium]